MKVLTKPTRCPFCDAPAVVYYKVTPLPDSSALTYLWEVVGDFPVCPGPCTEMMEERERTARKLAQGQPDIEA